MKLFSKLTGSVAAGIALLATSGAASALTVDGAVFSGSVAGSGQNWTLTMNLNFTGANATSEFLGDSLESWSLQLPGTATITLTSVSAGSSVVNDWKWKSDGKTDGTGCGLGKVDAVCVDFGTLNVIDGGGPVISTASNFQFVVSIVFASAQNDYATTFANQNFHILSVRQGTQGCGQTSPCWTKDGGLISLPLGSSGTASGSTGGANGSVPASGSTLTLLGLGLLGLGFARRTRAAQR